METYVTQLTGTFGTARAVANEYLDIPKGKYILMAKLSALSVYRIEIATSNTADTNGIIVGHSSASCIGLLTFNTQTRLYVKAMSSANVNIERDVRFSALMAIKID